ncbi:hypothetical protein [Chitinophaga sp. OAE865]|uniref:hypothetical protein n=1 Tax=Chitinophaga sp. OAE865 TaxID=2817898 RepID=UPI001AE56C6A
MKQKTSKQNSTALNKHRKDHDDKTPPSANEFNTPDFYILSAYSNPFIPVVDLSFAMDELIKMVKGLFPGISKHKNTYQNTTK